MHRTFPVLGIMQSKFSNCRHPSTAELCSLIQVAQSRVEEEHLSTIPGPYFHGLSGGGQGTPEGRPIPDEQLFLGVFGLLLHREDDIQVIAGEKNLLHETETEISLKRIRKH
ncbi:hypothetical protein V2J09_011827 [Rumex salicifolius]